jgi:hypothetical protein
MSFRPYSKSKNTTTTTKTLGSDYVDHNICADLIQDMKSLTEIGAPKKSLKKKDNKNKIKKSGKPKANYRDVPFIRLNQITQKFITKIIKLGHKIQSLEPIGKILLSDVIWKSFDFKYPNGGQMYSYIPQIGDTIQIVSGQDEHKIYCSPSMNWVDELPKDKDALSWRVFIFNTEKSMLKRENPHTETKEYTGELVLQQVENRPTEYEIRMVKKAKEEGNCCAYDTFQKEEHCSNCGYEDCDCGAELPRCKHC